MTSRRFKFSSPGIFLKEIDQSQIPGIAAGIGPVIIGRTAMGPGLRPVTVGSFDDFVNIFGMPESGLGGGDQWRDGNTVGPTYAAYAAQAYLRSNGPATIIRLLGEQSPSAVAGGEAGWATKSPTSSMGEVDLLSSAGGGAYGLFICDSGSAPGTHSTGTLAAIFYCGQGAPVLSGTIAGTSATTASNAMFIDNVSNSPLTFKVNVVSGSSVEDSEKFKFNFNPTDKNFIRRVFNTNPTLLNGQINSLSETKTYWLGETFENDVRLACTGSDQIAIILGLKANGTGDGEKADYRFEMHEAKTPWIVSQHLGSPETKLTTHSDVEKLFRLVCLYGGEWPSKNLKVSLTNIKASKNIFEPYGSFDVLIRKANDIDTNIEIIERFSNLNLNPKSSDYISKRIGDQFMQWNDAEAAYRLIGDNPNRSAHFRIELADKLKNGGLNKDLIPFGYYGPPRLKPMLITSGSVPSNPTDNTDMDKFYVKGHSETVFVETISSDSFVHLVDGQGDTAFSASFVFPSVPLRLNTKSVSTSKPENVFFGIDTEQTDSTLFNYSYGDINRPAAKGLSDDDKSVVDEEGYLEYSYYFTLDNISGTTTQAPYHASYAVGSRQGETSITALSGTKELLDRGHDKFTMPVIGGHDGLDLLEQEPFGQHVLSSAATEEGSSAYYSVNKALSSVADPEAVEMNLLVAPGIINKNITKRMIDICQTRGDALAIVDIENDYIPSTDSSKKEYSRIGAVKDAIETLDNRAINSSFGCVYYPWVQVFDTLSSNTLWMPPSVVALGTLGSSETRSELWFAPAGFTRGGLSAGASGLNVVGIRQRLNSKDRDKLYEVNINPIASFPAEGIVIFGQKTLQVTQSALDRINVRRLMIFIKREITAMARDILFDQNVTATWQRFLSRVNPFLTNVKIRFGLVDFRVVLDETTTTPDLIDRNILYAKVYVQPARSIEYIAVDFMITNTGAEFG